MSKRYSILFIIIFLLAIGGGLFFAFSSKRTVNESFQGIVEPQCEADKMTFYYLDQCSWCQKVKNEGTMSKIEDLGVKVKQVDANIGPLEHQFSKVPTFVINEKIYSGYRTFEQLEELLGCPKEES